MLGEVKVQSGPAAAGPGLIGIGDARLGGVPWRGARAACIQRFDLGPHRLARGNRAAQIGRAGLFDHLRHLRQAGQPRVLHRSTLRRARLRSPSAKRMAAATAA